MDYKKILKSRSVRLQVLRLLSFVPDKQMIQIQYRIKTGRKLDLKDPKRFTEKLQWYKLYYKNPVMIQCVDKYDVREYVKSKGLQDILIHCYGVYDSADEIEWDRLPQSFVLKDTLGGGGSSVIIVKDKSKENIEDLKNSISKWTAIEANKPDGGREWPYYCGKKHRIIIEELIGSESHDLGLTEYKFFCFYGKVSFLYVLADRSLGNSVALGIFDDNFVMQDALRKDERPLTKEIKKPGSFDIMKKIAEKLSVDFPEARIDLYDVDGSIKFGEITFFDGSGYMTFVPDSFDFELGKHFQLSKYDAL